MPPVRPLVAALALVSLQCAAAPFGLQVGDARLGFDVPGGFTDSTPTGSPPDHESARSNPLAPCGAVDIVENGKFASNVLWTSFVRSERL